MQARWKSIRDKYVREKKNLEQRSGSACVKKDTWELYPYLHFLNEHIKPRQTSGNIKPMPLDQANLKNRKSGGDCPDVHSTELPSTPVISDNSSAPSPFEINEDLHEETSTAGINSKEVVLC